MNLQLDKQPDRFAQETSSSAPDWIVWDVQLEKKRDRCKTESICQKASSSETLGDTLFEKPPDRAAGKLAGGSDSSQSRERLADDMVRRLFQVKMTDHPVPKPENDSAALIEHEKKSWSSRVEFVKWAGGVHAAYRWAPKFMPDAPEAALITWKKATGAQQIAFGGITHAEAMKELKARYTASCVGGMAAGWTVSHFADELFFSHDQYLECTLAGDVLGIGLAIAVPDWRRKALLVGGTHLLGRGIDHFRQPHY